MHIDASALRSLADERGLSWSHLVSSIEQALLVAYHHTDGSFRDARVALDPEKGTFTVWAVDPDDAVNTDGTRREFDDTPDDFGRIAANTARNVLMQRLRESDDDASIAEFQGREGEIVSGVVQQSRDLRDIKVDLGTVEGVIPASEQVPTDSYEHGARIKAVLTAIKKGQKGPEFILSRTHPELVRNLFRLESPEISDGTVEIVTIAREAGHRSKIAVKSNDPSVNAKGACIGPNGQRARAVTAELQGEKIDIVDWDEDPAVFVANALSPAKVAKVEVVDLETRSAWVEVPDYQLSLAIGREGQNARLAARLTGWRIDIHSDAEQGTPPAGSTPDSASDSTVDSKPDSGVESAEEPAAESGPESAAPQV